MRATGIIRRVDDLGRIVIPKEIRRTMGISEGTPMEIYASADGVVLQKYYPQIELSDMTKDLMEAVERMYGCFGSQKTDDIIRRLQEIQKILQHENERSIEE